MEKIVITRPNGETEYAILTTEVNMAGNDRLTIKNEGTTYYARLGPELSTHMFVIKHNGEKLYVQKEPRFTWEYVMDGVWMRAREMVIPRDGRYRVFFHVTGEMGAEGNEIDTTFARDAIFLEGNRFNGDVITTPDGRVSFKLINTSTKGSPGDEDYENTKTVLHSIQYISPI